MAHGLEDVVDVIRLDPAQQQQRPAGQADVDQRLLGTEAEAAHRRQLHVQAARVDGRLEGRKDPLRAIAAAAGAHADRDARTIGRELGQPGFASAAEAGQVGDLIGRPAVAAARPRG